MTGGGGPIGPGSGGPGCTTGGASDAGFVTTAGGNSGGGGGGTVSWNSVPGTIAAIAFVAPTRSCGRRASKREAGNEGEGSASANTADPSGSFGRALNPAGSITRASAVKVA